MNNLDNDINAYEGMKSDLEARIMGKWVLIHDSKLIDKYDSFEAAAEDAVKRFDKGPYLIRQVGAPPVTLSASVIFNLENV